MRLDKYLAETAQCTRSEAKTMLAKGRVQVNGAVCKKGDTQLKEYRHRGCGRRAAALSEVRLPHAQ